MEPAAVPQTEVDATFAAGFDAIGAGFEIGGPLVHPREIVAAAAWHDAELVAR
ncbi:hypothetical protein D3C83_286920 [compost metagenome]